MRELHLKDLATVAKNVTNFTVVLEPTDENLDTFSLHIRARGKGGGTLYTERGDQRTFKNLTTALRLIKQYFGASEILILLEPRKKNDAGTANARGGTGGKNPQKPGREKPT